MGESGGVPGHHVRARPRRSRALVKAVSPAARGRSGAESLDEGEASPTITGVMAGQIGRAGRFVTRRQGSACRGLCAFEIRLVVKQAGEPPLVVDEREKTRSHRTDLRCKSQSRGAARHLVLRTSGRVGAAGLRPCARC
jgi:hypothetical protein